MIEKMQFGSAAPLAGNGLRIKQEFNVYTFSSQHRFHRHIDCHDDNTLRPQRPRIAKKESSTDEDSPSALGSQRTRLVEARRLLSNLSAQFHGFERRRHWRFEWHPLQARLSGQPRYRCHLDYTVLPVAAG